MVVGVHKRGRRGVGRVHRDTKSRPAFLWTQVFSKYNSFAIFSTLIKRRRIVNFSVNVSRNRNKNLEVRPRGIRGRGVRRRRGGHGTRTSRTRARITRTRGTRTWWSRRWGRGNGDVLPPDYIQVRHKLIIIFNCIDRSRVCRGSRQIATQLYVLRWSYGRSGPSLRIESESGEGELGSVHARGLVWDTNMAAVTSCENTLYRIAFGADTKRYPGWYERQRHRTQTSRSHTSNISVTERLAERVWWPKS